MTNGTQATRTPPPQVADDEIDLLALFGTLWDSRFLIAGITFIFAVLGVAYALLAQPVYRANAIVQVEEKAGTSLPGMSEMSDLFGMESDAVTEIELIKSRAVIGVAVDKLNLDIEVEPKYFPMFGNAVARRYTPTDDAPVNKAPLGLRSFAWGGEQISIPTFTVPDTQFSEKHVLAYQGDGTFTLYNPDGEAVLEGSLGVEAAANGYRLFVSSITARPGTEFVLTKKRRLTTIIEYQEELGASERGKDSGIIALSLEDADWEQAKTILNVISQNYLRQNVERQSAEAAQSLEFLRNQLPEVKKGLEDAERKFNDYQVRAGSVNISAEAEALLEQVVDIESAIAELQLQKAELDRKYTTDHPAYQAWREQMAEQRKRKEEMNQRVKNLPETQQELLGLKRDLEVSTAIYTQMLNGIQELDIVRAGTVGNVRIVDDAAVDIEEPVKPKKALIAVIATLLGGFIGVAIVLVRAAINRGVTNPEDLENIGLPVYASVPLSEVQNRLDRITGRVRRTQKKTQHPKALLAERDPTDVAIESLRSLRTSLHFAMMDAKNNIMMISGPSPNVGKSFISGNLAAVIAQAGQRVLLVDMDMRRGYMHQMFGFEPQHGLSEVLAGSKGLAESILPTKVEGLSLLPRGQVPPNPSELLMSKRLSTTLEQLSSDYDLVIVDTPPILAVTDAAIVGRQCAVTMLVARFALNPVKELELTRSRFEQNGTEVKGVIFNAVERRAAGYGYGYGYYNYEYKSAKD